MKYGDIFKTTAENVERDFEILLNRFSLKKGDSFCSDIRRDLFSPVLVLSSEDFLDVEYIFVLDSKIYSREEAKIIMQEYRK